MDSFIIIQGYLRGLWGSLPFIVVIAVVCLAVIILLVLLALKQIKIWVRKTDTQIETLKNIDTKLTHIHTQSGYMNVQSDKKPKRKIVVCKTKKLKNKIPCNSPDKTTAIKTQETAVKLQEQMKVTDPITEEHREYKSKPGGEDFKPRITAALKDQSGQEKSSFSNRRTKNVGRSGKEYTLEELEQQILE